MIVYEITSVTGGWAVPNSQKCQRFALQGSVVVLDTLRRVGVGSILPSKSQ